MPAGKKTKARKIQNKHKILAAVLLIVLAAIIVLVAITGGSGAGTVQAQYQDIKLPDDLALQRATSDASGNFWNYYYLATKPEAQLSAKIKTVLEDEHFIVSGQLMSFDKSLPDLYAQNGRLRLNVNFQPQAQGQPYAINVIVGKLQ